MEPGLTGSARAGVQRGLEAELSRSGPGAVHLHHTSLADLQVQRPLLFCNRSYLGRSPPQFSQITLKTVLIYDHPLNFLK